MLDPWSAGGVLVNVSTASDLIAFWMSDSAHHLDLRLPNPVDPASV